MSDLKTHKSTPVFIETASRTQYVAVSEAMTKVEKDFTKKDFVDALKKVSKRPSAT